MQPSGIPGRYCMALWQSLALRPCWDLPPSTFRSSPGNLLLVSSGLRLRSLQRMFTITT